MSVGVIVVLLFFALVAPRALSGFFSTIFSPLWRVAASSYSAENSALRQQLEAQSSDVAALALLEQENADLKSMLGRTVLKNTVLAVVLKKPPFSAYDEIVIDIGADHGLVVGNTVYAVSSPSAGVPVVASTSVQVSASSSPVSSNVRVPIGLVAEVDSTTSKVNLFSSPGNKYVVEIGKNHLAETATGRGAGTFDVVLPREAKISIGDLVVIPSIEPLVFATVSDIESNPAQPYATVLFQSPLNPFALHWVEVEVKPEIKPEVKTAPLSPVKK